MANHFTIENDGKLIQEMLFKLFQSTRLNFIVGSGASMPAISIAGDLEFEVQDDYDDGNEEEATLKLYNFLEQVNTSTNQLVNKVSDVNKEVVQSGYNSLVKNIEKILNERRTNLLPKQVNIFTTNYDLFVEDSLDGFDSISLNDGFNRIPSLSGEFKFSTNTFFNSTFNNGNLYSYKVELPTINLFKMHGSMSWEFKDKEIIFSIPNRAPLTPGADSAAMDSYNRSHALILPRKHKFEETVLQHVYYDLLRLYANELDKENTTLLAFGFSFADEHISEITQRALKNPTLKIVIFAFDDAAKDGFVTLFDAFHNVDVISTGNAKFLNFEKLNEIIRGVLPEEEDDAA